MALVSGIDLSITDDHDTVSQGLAWLPGQECTSARLEVTGEAVPPLYFCAAAVS
jgi:hypothetical protein